MIFITGDCHHYFDKLNEYAFPEQKEMTKEDYVIICGDFGGVWYKDPGKKEEIQNLRWLEKRPFTTLFVDGNHENFDRLYDYPVESWKGGKIHRIRPSIIHLMRGQVFEICGKKIFTFGGASSHDISGGILDPAAPDFPKRLETARKGDLPYRVRGFSWWERELPTDEELEEGRRNLKEHNWTVDYIVTHCCASSTQKLVGGDFEADSLTDYLDEIRTKTKFLKWFFGHYHDNRNINREELLLYEQIIRIA